MKKVIIDDVAREAGVSISTVSRVLNNLPVKESTRLRVQEVIKQFKYIPNPMARGLTGQKSFSIGVLVPSLGNHYFTDMVESIEQTLRAENFMTFLSITDGDPDKEKTYLKELINRKVDGIISIDSTLENCNNGFFEKAAQQIPFVTINGAIEDQEINAVMTDQKQGAVKALKKLKESGCDHIWFMRGQNSHSYDIKEEVFRNFPLSKKQILTVPLSNHLEAIARAEDCLTKELQSAPELPQAIFACNDIMALGALYALEKADIQVPEQVSIMGHDNTVISQLGNIKLSSVDLKMRVLGSTGAELLIQLINEPLQIPKKIVFNPEVICRESTI